MVAKKIMHYSKCKTKNKKEKITNIGRKHCKDNIGSIIISENVFRHSGRMSIKLMDQERKPRIYTGFEDSMSSQALLSLLVVFSDLCRV